MIKAKVLADSISPCGKRLTTYECTYPRSIHSEILTHKVLSRNSASSRAIPTEKLIKRIEDDPFVPVYIGANQKGMQAGAELSEEDRALAVAAWLTTRDFCVSQARGLVSTGVHKQVVNRMIEPWMWITVIISTTEDTNFFGLRDHEAAEPHFQELARKMRAARDASEPKHLRAGQWHLPLFGKDGCGHEDDWEALALYLAKNDQHLAFKDDAGYYLTAAKISVGRCARVSYLTHDGRRDLKDDIVLHDRLVVARPLHASPAEHVAQALDWPRWWHDRYPGNTSSVDEIQNTVVEWCRLRGTDDYPPEPLRDMELVLSQLRSGNFMGFRQYRKTLKDEHIGGLRP